MPVRTKTIQWRILVRQLPLLVLLFVSVLYWLGEDLKGLLLSANLENARQSSQSVVYAVEASMLAEEGHQVWDRVVEKIPRLETTQISIVDPHGIVLFSTNSAERGTRRSLNDPLCARCHEAGSPAAHTETTFIRDPDDEDYQVFAAPLRNTEDCRPCHAASRQKLGMVLVRQSLTPIQAQVSAVQTKLTVVGLITLLLAMITTRALLARYLGRPLKRLVAGAKAIGAGDLQSEIEIAEGTEFDVLAETLNHSRARLAGMVHQLERQRDNSRTLYRLVDQLSRSVTPRERRQRGVELAAKILGTDCILIRSGYGERVTSRGIATFRQGSSIVERSLRQDSDENGLPVFFSRPIIDRWAEGQLDSVTEFCHEQTVAYPLHRSGQRLGLLLRPAQPFDDQTAAAGAAPDEEMVRALCKDLAIALEFSDLQRERVEEARLAAIGETVAGLAHWLKNTLNGLRAGQYIIDRAVRLDNREKLDKGWTVMKKSIRQVEKLTSDVLYCAKERTPDREFIDPNRIIQDVVDLLTEKARDQGVKLVTDLGDDIGCAWLDRESISRALLNLVANGIDACADKESDGTVTIQSRVMADVLALSISDDGIGMPPEVRRNLFKRFYSTKGSKGTGLGLMVVKKIIDEHGGSVQVESRLGEGAAFHLRIPMAGSD